MHIQITTSTFGKAGNKPIHYLDERGVEYRLNPYGRQLSEEEAIELLKGVEGVIAGTEPLTKRVLEKLPDLKVISRCGTGTNNVDLETAEEKQIRVFNTPDIHVDAVAELALTGTLSMMRHVAESDASMRNGIWKKRMGRSLYNKRVGLIGYGKVGKRFAELLTPFTDYIYYFDPLIKDQKDTYIATYMEWDEILSETDIISLHIPFIHENYHLIGKNELEKLKSDAVIVNTSRGGLIDEHALYTFLKNNPEAAAYLDVFEEEPYMDTLVELKNILLTPHVGTTTKETREEMEYQACVNLIEGLNNE